VLRSAASGRPGFSLGVTVLVLGAARGERGGAEGVLLLLVAVGDAL
jgi:hypothetical protein